MPGAARSLSAPGRRGAHDWVGDQAVVSDHVEVTSAFRAKHKSPAVGRAMPVPMQLASQRLGAESAAQATMGKSVRSRAVPPPVSIVDRSTAGHEMYIANSLLRSGAVGYPWSRTVCRRVGCGR